jgi:hypothetical protein
MKNQEVYKGQMENGLKQGPGKYFWPSGDVFQGLYDNDLVKGQFLTFLLSNPHKSNS